MEPWNNPSILSPPVSTVLCTSRVDVEDLSHACSNAVKVLSKQSPLHKESAVLSRFLYKFDMKFRNDIGYKILKKINTSLRRYLTLNLLKDIQNFVAVIPSKDEEQYLPTRQMMEYVLIRIMSFSKIMMRVSVCSKQAAIHYMNRVKRGESHWMSLMPYALLSRIWTMSTVLLQHSCVWYTSLYKYIKVLQPKGLAFLPADYTIPPNLGKWLDIDNIDNFGQFEWSHKNSIQINEELGEDDDIRFDNILNYVKDINSEDNDKYNMAVEPVVDSPKAVQRESLNMSHSLLPLDQGETISREYFQSFFHKQPDNNTQFHRNQYQHSADAVVNKTTLDKFVSTEEDYRNKNSELSLTKHLSFMQWQTLKVNLVNLSDILSNNRKIERKFKKIWKEKCLDYL